MYLKGNPEVKVERSIGIDVGSHELYESEFWKNLIHFLFEMMGNHKCDFKNEMVH